MRWKDNGVTVKFVAFPVPGHSPSNPLRSRDVWRRVDGVACAIPELAKFHESDDVTSCRVL